MSDRHRMLASTANFGGVERLTTFISTHRRWPSPNSSEGSERALYSWLDRARKSYRTALIDPAISELLDTSCPGWQSTRVKPWTARFTQLVDFVSSSQRFPSQLGDPDEGTLYRWLYAQRTAADAGALTPEKMSLLDANTPGWRSAYEMDRAAAPAVRVIPTWEETLDQAEELYKRDSELPRTTSADLDEQRIARWLMRQRQSFTRGSLTAARRERLDKALPGWKDSPRNDEGKLHRARQLGEYYRKVGRWPYRHDRDPASRTLERWLRTQRSLGRDNLSPEFTAQLDEHAPGWDSPFRHTPPTRPQRTP